MCRRRCEKWISKRFRRWGVSRIVLVSSTVLLVWMWCSMLTYHVNIIGANLEVAQLLRPPWGYPHRLLGGMHSLGHHNVAAPRFVTILEREEESVWLPRHLEKAKYIRGPEEAVTENEPLCLTMQAVPDALVENRKKHTVSKVVYDGTKTQGARSRSRRLWSNVFEDELVREFGQDTANQGMRHVDSHIPLFQPLWGTMNALLNKSLPNLQGPPSLAVELDVGCRPKHVLAILPARRTRCGWSNRLNVSPNIAQNIAAMVAEQLDEHTSSISFAIPIMLENSCDYVGKQSDDPSSLWELLGLRSASQFEGLFPPTSGTVSISSTQQSVTVTRVQPISRTGEVWCEEATVSSSYLMTVVKDHSENNFYINVSVTELLCEGLVSSGISDSLATAVHIGAIIGNIATTSHVIVLSEDNVVHTLPPADHTLFHEVMQGTIGGGVGAGFVGQLLAPWQDTTCDSPHAVQAIVLKPLFPSNTTRSPSSTSVSELIVDHHGVNFAFKRLMVPSMPTIGTSLFTDDGSRCSDDSPCVHIDDVVNSVFQPFTVLEGVVPTRRRHMLPGHSRRALGVVSEAEARDILKAATPKWRRSVSAVDAVSPSAVCVLATSFQKVNGYFGKPSQSVLSLEDVVDALRVRLLVALAHMPNVGMDCTSGGFLAAALRVLRVTSRVIIGPTHAASEDQLIGWRLSDALRQLHSSGDDGAPSGRPTMSEFIVKKAPLVASSGRVVRTPISITISSASLSEVELSVVLSPRLIHMGMRGEVNSVLQTNGTALLFRARQAAASLRNLVAGIPSSVCVPDSLLAAVEEFQTQLSQYSKLGNKLSLPAILARKFHPWRGLTCARDDHSVCTARGFVHHVHQMLQCDGMGEWLRRVSDDFQILEHLDISTYNDFGKWELAKRDTDIHFLEEARSQAISLFDALCERWDCRRLQKSGAFPNTISEFDGAKPSSDLPGAEVDVTQIVELGSDISNTSDFPLVTAFADRVLRMHVPSLFTEQPGQTIHSFLWGTEGAAMSPKMLGQRGQLEGPFTLWQQWFLRYVRLLLQTYPAPTLSLPSMVFQPLALSGQERLYRNWTGLARSAQRSRSKLSTDFAISRFIPSSLEGDGMRGKVLTNLLSSQSTEEADRRMQTALDHLQPYELGLLLRAPLLREGEVASRSWCSASSRVVESPMVLSRAVIRHLKGRSWDMGPDAVVDGVDESASVRLDCTMRGLSLLDEVVSGAIGRRLEMEMSTTKTPLLTIDSCVWWLANEMQAIGCVLPKSMVASVISVASRLFAVHPNVIQNAYDALYYRLQRTVYREALRMLDTTGVLTLEAIEQDKGKGERCTERLPMSGSSFLPGERILWRIPCFGCSGFMKETTAYIPPLIEDKGLPMTISAADSSCLCLPERNTPSQQAQDSLHRSRSLSCDNRCMPFLKSGTTQTLDGKELGRQIWSNELYGDQNAISSAFFAQRQRYFKPPLPSEINIVIDSINADMLYSTDLEISGFSGIDIPTKWNANLTSVAPSSRQPFDMAVASSIFSTYASLGVQMEGDVERPRRRLYRICRAMYEADRISKPWVAFYTRFCDEIWVPGNWVRRMFINSFVTPLLEVALITIPLGASESNGAYLGHVEMSPATTKFTPLTFDLGSFDESMSLDEIGETLGNGHSFAGKIINRLTGASTKLSRLLGDTVRAMYPGKRDDLPLTLLWSNNGELTQWEAAIQASKPIEEALRMGFVHLKHPTQCEGSCPRRAHIGNSTHMVVSRLKFESPFDLSRIVVLPEAIDVHTMDPTVTETLDSQPTSPKPTTPRPGLFQPGDITFGWERWCSRKCFRGEPGKQRFLLHNESFRFFSVFKWEPRKGWRELMESFYKAFYSPLFKSSLEHGEPVLIVLGTSYTPKAKTFESIFLSQRVNELAQRRRWPLARGDGGDVDNEPSGRDNYAGRSDFPCTCFLSEAVREEDITALYRSANAFVTTTRGEGWGLPGSEAMAMGLPIISTNWGGSTEFMSLGSMPVARHPRGHDVPTSYAINVSVVEMPSLSTGYGGENNMRMASVSVEHTVALLRQVYSQGSQVNSALGKRSQDVIVNHFSQEATTDLMAVRLAAVVRSLRGESEEEFAAALDRQRDRLSGGKLV